MEDGTPDRNMEAFPQTRKDVERETPGIALPGYLETRTFPGHLH